MPAPCRYPLPLIWLMVLSPKARKKRWVSL